MASRGPHESQIIRSSSIYILYNSEEFSAYFESTATRQNVFTHFNNIFLSNLLFAIFFVLLLFVISAETASCIFALSI